MTVRSLEQLYGRHVVIDGEAGAAMGLIPGRYKIVLAWEHGHNVALLLAERPGLKYVVTPSGLGRMLDTSDPVES